MPSSKAGHMVLIISLHGRHFDSTKPILLHHCFFAHIFLFLTIMAQYRACQLFDKSLLPRHNRIALTQGPGQSLGWVHAALGTPPSSSYQLLTDSAKQFLPLMSEVLLNFFFIFFVILYCASLNDSIKK